MTVRKKVEITIETEQILIIRRTERRVEVPEELQIETKSQTGGKVIMFGKTVFGKMLKRLMLSLFVFTLTCGAVLAQSGPREAPAVPRTGVITPAQKPAVGLTTIWTNLYPVANSVYGVAGFYVTGADNSVSQPEQWIALPFTPAASGHVEELEVALTYVSGTSEVNISLASDDGGNVGTALGTKIIKDIPAWGSCCTMVTVHFKAPGIAVTKDTQYWIVATPNDFATDFTGVWDYTQQAWYTYNSAETGWQPPTHVEWPAAAVLGTIP